MAGDGWKIGETAANSLRFELELGAGVVDLREVMRRLGLIFVANDFGEDGGDGRYVKTGDQAVVVVNTRVQHSGRVRFTIAHEIGHHMLHSEGLTNVAFVDDQVGGGGTKDPKEVEADAFAAYLLAPTKALKADVEALKTITFDDVVDLMVRYGLSYRALAYRLNNSGIINKKQADALIAESEGQVETSIKAKGGYAEDARVLGETAIPDELRENALKLYAHGAINAKRLAEMLRLDEKAALGLAEERGIAPPEIPEIDDSDLAGLFDDAPTGREQ